MLAIVRSDALLARTVKFATITAAFSVQMLAQNVFPRNASNCDQCHSVPLRFGSSRLTVERAGSIGLPDLLYQSLLV